MTTFKERLAACASDQGFDDPKDMLEFFKMHNLRVVRKEELARYKRMERELSRIIRWDPCLAEPEPDDDEPVYSGLLTNNEGEWVRFADVKWAIRK